MKLNSLIILSLIIMLYGCGKDSEVVWSIPVDEVFDGGVGRDGIPSIDEPQFSSVDQITSLDDSDLVVGFVSGGLAKAYPHEILDWHEIVNDELNGDRIAITYCPLTGTAIGWNREVNGITTEFGVSGLLYNSNLIPYDRATGSNWSQMSLDCVSGERIGEIAELFPLIETTWATWKEMYPNSDVLNENTGFANRDYDVYPYEDYITNHDFIIFPVTPVDNRLPAKDRALAVLGSSSQTAYPLALFGNGRVIEDTLDGTDLLIVGSASRDYMLAFENNLGLQNLVPVSDNLPVIGVDDDGNELLVTGVIQSGPLEGQRLNPTNSFVGYWFSLGAFYPGIRVFQ